MTRDTPTPNTQRLTPNALLLAIILLLSLWLRVVALGSDAYAGLSWSSGLLTDEGFYTHDARNRIRFGVEGGDDFRNNLIMPTLHVVQGAVFRGFGVGWGQARAISVVCSLLTLPIFYFALRRAFCPKTALYGSLFLALDHVVLLYNRLALMDTPAMLLLVLAFWSGVQVFGYSGVRVFRCSGIQVFGYSGVQEGGGEVGRRYWEEVGRSRGEEVGRRYWEVGRSRLRPYCLLPTAYCLLTGVFLGVAYTTRGLTALLWPVPFLVFWRRWREMGWIAAGLLSVLVLYGVFWYLPHREELSRVNSYYLLHQLLPESWNRLRLNITLALFGDQYGLFPFLMRHSPVTLLLAGLGVGYSGIQGESIHEEHEETRKSLPNTRKTQTPPFPSEERTAREGGPGGLGNYLTLWLLLLWGVFSVVSYAPSRYYLLFYPAMAGLAGYALVHLETIGSVVWNSRRVRTLLGSFLSYHLVTLVLHPHGAALETVRLLVVGGVAGLLWRGGRFPTQGVKPLIVGLLLLWAGVQVGWYTDWGRNLSYRQREAGQWLTAHLPPGSILIGDVGPALALEGPFRAVPVIPGLCNDQQPVEKYAPAPRYIVILDDAFREKWWSRHYPQLIAPERRLKRFPNLVRFDVGVYAVP